MPKRRNVPSRREPGRSNNQTIIGVLMLIGALLLAATAIVLIINILGEDEEQEIPEVSSSSSSELPEYIPSSSSESEQIILPSSSSSEASSSESPAPTPSSSSAPPPSSSSVAPSSSSSSSSASSSSSSSSENTGGTTEYDEYGYYEEEETLENVAISIGEVTLMNKTINGNLTIASNVIGLTELINCEIKGEIMIRGGDTVYMEDTDVGSIILRSTNDSETKLVAEGKSDIGKLTMYTNVILDESGASGDGFTDVEVREENYECSIYMISTELGTVTINEDTEIDIDSSSEIERIEANRPTTITGDGTIGRLYIASDDIESSIEPEQISKVSDRYEDLDLT